MKQPFLFSLRAWFGLALAGMLMLSGCQYVITESSQTGVEIPVVEQTAAEESETDLAQGSTVIGATNVAKLLTMAEIGIADEPNEAAAIVATLNPDQVIAVLGTNETNSWWLVECPTGVVGECWLPVNPGLLKTIAVHGPDGFQIVESVYVSFQIPLEWRPAPRTPGQGSVLEEWILGIPGLESDQVLAFFDVPFADLQPIDVVSEYPFTIGGKEGVKWVRAGEGYVSYDYYTTSFDGVNSFGIHVTVAEEVPELEVLLDQIAAAIVFHE